MEKIPKSLRVQIGLFGRTNVGKSSFLNRIAAQDVAITSPIPGTTTDVVEKVMELLPIGPVVFLDTAGVDDSSNLAGARLERTRKAFDRADVFALVTEAGVWTDFEETIAAEAGKRKAPLVIVQNKADLAVRNDNLDAELRAKTPHVMSCSCLSPDATLIDEFKCLLLAAIPNGMLHTPPLIGDLIPAGGMVALIIPIDSQAPKGRLILPQVQAIRDVLDHNATVLAATEKEYADLLSRLKTPPDLVVCDSQVVMKMAADTPKEIPCTTFSILLARSKGDLAELSRGAGAINRLRPGDRVLIAESCSHHAAEDDIGRVKIPRWLRQYTGLDLQINIVSGRDFPWDLSDYRLVIHCGSCMLTRGEMLVRLQRAKEAGVAITNYGVAISVLQGVAERVLSPFPAALEAYRIGIPPLPPLKEGGIPGNRKVRIK